MAGLEVLLRTWKKDGYGEYFPWNSDEEVVEHLLKPSNITLKTLEEHPEGIWFGERCYDIRAKNQIRTPSGKIELYHKRWRMPGMIPCLFIRNLPGAQARSPELSKAIPSDPQYWCEDVEYTHWQMRHVPELRRLAPDPVAEVHPDTAARYGIRDGDLVIIETKKGQMKIKAKITDDILLDIINVPHGWAKELNENVLTDMEPRDPVTGYPELRVWHAE